MLVSMTGFGSSNFEDSNLSINVELKSFNSRYFELNTKSFELSGPLEYKIWNYLKKHLTEGTIIYLDDINTFYRNPNKGMYSAILNFNKNNNTIFNFND